MSSFKKHLRSRTKQAGIVTSSNAPPIGVEAVTAVMLLDSLTRVTLIRPVIFFDTPKYVGVLK